MPSHLANVGPEKGFPKYRKALTASAKASLLTHSAYEINMDGNRDSYNRRYMALQAPDVAVLPNS